MNKKKVGTIITTDNEVCNEPHLCNTCNRNSEWPKCMKNAKLRGYHPIFKENWDEVVGCDNWEPEEDM